MGECLRGKEIFRSSFLFVFRLRRAGLPLDWNAQGPDFPAYNGNVEIYYDQEKIARPFGYIGTFNFSEKDISKCKKFAAAHGANGIVVENVKAYAFKYTDNLTNEEEALIRMYLTPRYYRD